GAWPQVHDRVAPVAVGHHAARFFDEDRTRGFDRDAGEHGARGVLHDACDGALRRRDRRKERQQHETETDTHPTESPHGGLLAGTEWPTVEPERDVDGLPDILRRL